MLINRQSNLTFTGNLPANYQIMIASTSNYGKITFNGVTGTTIFDIHSTSSVIENTTYTSVISGISDAVLARLMHHSFPGNIRELENIIEYGFILCPGGLIQEYHLPDSFHLEESAGSSQKGLQSDGLSLEEIEKQAILGALQRNKWKKMMTCRELGISKDTLRRKIERYNLENPLNVVT